MSPTIFSTMNPRKYHQLDSTLNIGEKTQQQSTRTTRFLMRTELEGITEDMIMTAKYRHLLEIVKKVEEQKKDLVLLIFPSFYGHRLILRQKVESKS